eukprot:scaffold6069_cov63-Attheya_sp.AAC.3
MDCGLIPCLEYHIFLAAYPIQSGPSSCWQGVAVSQRVGQISIGKVYPDVACVHTKLKKGSLSTMRIVSCVISVEQRQNALSLSTPGHCTFYVAVGAKDETPCASH